MKASRIFVTGANGFVGRHLCRALAAEGREVIGLVRPGGDVSQLTGIPALRLVVTANHDHPSSYQQDMLGADVVVHLAARVHVLHDTAQDPLAEFRKVNVENTRVLATAAAAAGVRRFIYVSSIKVNGEVTHLRSFEADDKPGFLDPYGQSKWEAEEAIREIADSSGMGWSIVRPPLVYGPGVRGNFLWLMKVLRRGIPLPLGAVRNRRSLVSVFNLVDLLKTMLDHPAAAGQRFMVKDTEDVSTSDLVRSISAGLKLRARLLPVPTQFLLAAGRLFKREEVIDRLCSSLVVNADKTTRDLGWVAPVPFITGIGRTCAWFNHETSGGVL